MSELTGGLGNQLFQYAVGYAAARRAGAKFALDLRHYKSVDPKLPSRPFALERFGISAAEMRGLENARVAYATMFRSRRRTVRLLGKLPGYRMPIIIDLAKGDDERLHQIDSSAYLIGCWQTEKLFNEYRNELLKEFAFKRPPTAQNAKLIAAMRERLAISIHFRRTDYLHPGTLTRPMGLDYYERALVAMNNAFPDAAYFVFADDPDWVRVNAALPDRHTIVTHNIGIDDCEDIRLMSHCDHFIIANSSFSWWGAWLARHPAKRVIAPKTWYLNGHGSEADLVPDRWIRM